MKKLMSRTLVLNFENYFKNEIILFKNSMPFVIRKLPHKDLYTVKNKITGQVHSYGSTHTNALKLVKHLKGLI